MNPTKFSWNDNKLVGKDGTEFGRYYRICNYGYYSLPKSWVAQVTDCRYGVRENTFETKEQAIAYLEKETEAPVFYTKKGFPTAYAYACGYLHRKVKPGKKIEISRSHGYYHVMFSTQTEPGKIWTSYETLKDAYRSYYKIKKEYFND